MEPTKTEYTNCMLLAPPGAEETVEALPVARGSYPNGQKFVESAWRLTWRERWRVLWSGLIYFTSWGVTHPPIRLDTYSNFDPHYRDIWKETRDANRQTD